MPPFHMVQFHKAKSIYTVNGNDLDVCPVCTVQHVETSQKKNELDAPGPVSIQPSHPDPVSLKKTLCLPLLFPPSLGTLFTTVLGAGA